MTPEVLEINVALQISKPITEVFEAIVNPEKCVITSFHKVQEEWKPAKTLFGNFPNSIRNIR
ncbi:MAG: hypothetical protein M0D53_00060 [Flavobacterium sp. JAD_PAG50586_2]|nr:MAG: hypothetical protein M0D53_00060 [Flavobacterium sp. JAD_PAG50586_2]